MLVGKCVCKQYSLSIPFDIIFQIQFILESKSLLVCIETSTKSMELVEDNKLYLFLFFFLFPFLFLFIFLFLNLGLRLA